MNEEISFSTHWPHFIIGIEKFISYVRHELHYYPVLSEIKKIYTFRKDLSLIRNIIFRLKAAKLKSTPEVAGAIIKNKSQLPHE